MRGRMLWIVTLVGCLVFAVATFAQKGGKKGGRLAVDVTFRDDSLDGIKSDGMPYRNGESKVLAIVGLKRGGFRLATNRTQKAGAGRTLSFDFTQCVLGTPCVSPFPSGLLQEGDARLGEEFAFDVFGEVRESLGTKLNIVAMEGGEMRFGALVFTIGSASQPEWWLIFGDNDVTDPCGDPVTVTRGGPAAGAPENSWTMEATVGDEACLFKVVGERGDFGGQLQGIFHMPFSITVEEQP